MKKRLFSIIAQSAVAVSIAVAAAVFFCLAPKRDSYTYITKATDLYSIKSDVTKNYKVGANFTASLGNKWTPIGTKEKPFSGTFDGQGCTITAINLSGKSNLGELIFGMFGYVTGIIKNVSFYCVDTAVNYDLSNSGDSSNFIGGFLCAVNYGEISNCKVIFASSITFSASAKGIFGGIIGISRGIVSMCSSYGTVHVKNANQIKLESAIGEKYFEEQITNLTEGMNYTNDN